MSIKKPYKQSAYDEAVSLRRRGFTYTEIAKICAVSRGTVSNWLKAESFSKKVAADNIKKAVKENTRRLSLINKARMAERKHQYQEALRVAATEYKHYKNNPLFIAGLATYMSLGDKKNPRTVRLSTTNATAQRLFIDFTTAYLAVPKSNIRFSLHLYPDHDVSRCMKYWCRQTGLSPAQFYKNQVIQGLGGGKSLHFGVGNTIIGSTLLKKKLDCWLTLMVKDLKNS